MARQGITRQAAAHFLEQATFGPTAAEVDLVVSQGYDQWLDNQFALAESVVPVDPDMDDIRNATFLNMANGPDQLRQRMIFALGQIIVVSSNKNGSGREMGPWVRLLSRHAFGSYRALLREVSTSAAMGKYLDNWLNRCTRDAARVLCPNGSATSTPNENFARELLQLFSLGLWQMNLNGTVKLDASGQPTPTYTQQDLVEYARALTGWTYARTNNADDFELPMVPNMVTVSGASVPRFHDLGQKVLLSGVVAPASANTTAALYADVDAVIDSIMRHPNVAPFVSTRLIRSLVTSNPTPNYIQRVATVFRDTDGNLRATLTAILTDPEARNFTITDGRLKDPFLHVLGLARALNMTVGNQGNTQWSFYNLQQYLLMPNTVFSFYSLLGPLPGNLAMFGPEFGIYPPALAVQRANFIYGILSDSYNSTFPMATALTPYLATAADPATLVETVNQNLMFGRMSQELRDLITAATAAIADTSQNALRERVRGALYLAAISSEFSVYTDTAVAAASSVQPPTGVAVSAQSGAVVTVSWRAPLIGPAPTGYILEGGVRPGEVLAQLPASGTAPTLTFQAPPGAYYIRVRTVSGAGISRPSSEIRLYVGSHSGPTAPRSLNGYGRGNSLVLTWTNTFGGGEPTGAAVDVAQNGARLTSIPMPLTNTWSFTGVPPGTYSFTVRATNAAGTSGSSNSITLTFPLSGCSAPGAPGSFAAAATGRVLAAHWLAPASGTAPTGYTLEARMRNANNTAWVPLGAFPISGLNVSSPVGPGRYEVRVRSENICGSSGYSPWRSVTVQ